MFFSLWEFLINFFEIVLFFIFIDTKLPKSTRFQNIRIHQSIFLVTRLIIICLMNYLQCSSWSTLIFSYCTEIGFTLLFYDGVLMLRIFWGTFFSVICLIADYITLFIPRATLGIDIQELLHRGPYRITFTMLYITLIAVIVFLVQHMSEENIHLTLKERIYYFTVAVSGIAVGHYIMIITLDSELLFHNDAFTSKLIFINLFFILLFLSLLLYIFKLGKTEATNIELIEKEKMHELEEMEYRNLLASTESLREMKHDISIHLNVIQSMIDHCSTEELTAYIADYTNELELAHKFISTGNIAIDCILSAKIDTARKLGITVDFSVIAPANFPLDSISTSSLIGNLWSNAIEACEKLKQQSSAEDLYISFYIKPFQDMVVIHMENLFDGYTKKAADGRFLSTKNGIDHGIGLKRISDIVENADGILQVKAEDHTFIVHIMLPERS